MEGRDYRCGLARDGSERILISCGDAGRLVAAMARQKLEADGLSCVLDQLLSDPETIPPLTLDRLNEAAILVLAISRRCNVDGWRLQLMRAAQAQHIPIVVFFEGREQEWDRSLVPSLVTADAAELLGFVARSRPDAASLWEFAQQFFVDRATARQFRRDAPNRWRWRRNPVADIPVMLDELSLSDEIIAAPQSAEVTLVEAKSIDGIPVLFLGTSDWKRYRLAWSREVRAVLPAPVWPGIEPIGFMHCDFDTAREWPRAGTPPVEIRLLGREVYGWHMSEYFWRAFIGGLPQLLGEIVAESNS